MPAQTPSLLSLDDALHQELSQWSAQGLERTLRAGWRRRPGEVDTADGRAIDFASNDYLGLASHPDIVAALASAAALDGVGATASRLIAGNHPEHEALERELAQFFGAAGALTFASGFAANVGTIPALVAAGDVIFADAFNHASLIDGCRLSRASVHVYPHSDMHALRELLSEHRRAARRALIVTDGLFSMDGDIANLPDIVSLAHEYGTWTYVDDAHAVGVTGTGGRGTPAHHGMEGAIDVTVGTLGKAFGVAGAFVYGSALLYRHLLNRARSFVFSTAMLPAQAAAARASVRLIAAGDDRRALLRENAQRVRAMLAIAGARVGGAGDSHIIPVFVGDAGEAMRLGAALRARGVLVGAVRPPTVAHGSSRLRVSVSAAHTPAQIAALAAAYAAARADTPAPSSAQ